jgi:hypothetical protein
MHPLSLLEADPRGGGAALARLLEVGGFPEPYFHLESANVRRWRNERVVRLVQDDLRGLEQVKELGQMELLAHALPGRVGSPLSLNSLREDLDVSLETVDRWISILERLYYCFRIPPWSGPKIRAVKKAQKLYLWDWGPIVEKGFRFENLVASQLLKYCHFHEDTRGERFELRYLRDVELREIDFVVLSEGKPLFAVECKSGARAVSPATRYLRERMKIPRVYQVHCDADSQADFGSERDDVRVLPWGTFCQELEMP